MCSIDRSSPSQRRHLAESDDAQPVHRRGLLGRHGYAARIDRHFNLLYTGAGLSCRTGTDFCVPKIFTGIAFDSGGVASGPMTTTFLLPFAMGACEALGGNVMTDASVL